MRASIRLVIVAAAAASLSAAAHADFIYVSLFNSNSVEKLNSSGNVITTYTSPALSQPEGLAFDSSGNLYVAGGSGVEKFAQSGTDLGAFATVSTANGLAFDASGNLYVEHGFGSGSVEEYSATGTDLGTFVPSSSRFLSGLAFDGSGSLYAVNGADTSNGGDRTIERYGPTGSYLGTFANIGAAQTIHGIQLNLVDVAMDASGNVYWPNNQTNVVEKFSSTGTDLGPFANSGINNPVGLAFGSTGNLYVANFAGSIEEFSSTGTDLGAIATGLNGPEYIAVTNDAGTPLPLPPAPVPEPKPLASILITSALAWLILFRRKTSRHRIRA